MLWDLPALFTTQRLFFCVKTLFFVFYVFITPNDERTTCCTGDKRRKKRPSYIHAYKKHRDAFHYLDRLDACDLYDCSCALSRPLSQWIWKVRLRKQSRRRNLFYSRRPRTDTKLRYVRQYIWSFKQQTLRGGTLQRPVVFRRRISRFF